MANSRSKKTVKGTKAANPAVKAKKPVAEKVVSKPAKNEPAKKASFRQRFKERIYKRRAGRVRLHKSFRRSYREDYYRDLEVPGLIAHAMMAFKLIFKNWKTFLLLIILMVILNIVFVGMMNEATYRQLQDVLDQTGAELTGGEIGNFAKASLLLVSTITTGGLSGNSGESAVVFGIIIFLITWLTTIFILRHRLAEHKVKLRDALYNAMSPIISTLVVFLVILFQCIPLFILIIIYSTAVSTDFLATPFYALIFCVFAAAMILLSGYLISSSFLALVAVSAPGLYPMKAIHTASDLMAGRRIRFVIRLVYLFCVLVFVWIVVGMPMILIDFWIKSSFAWTEGFPLVPIVLLSLTCFTMIYMATYLYLYYRWMLNYDEN